MCTCIYIIAKIRISSLEGRVRPHQRSYRGSLPKIPVAGQGLGIRRQLLHSPETAEDTIAFKDSLLFGFGDGRH